MKLVKGKHDHPHETGQIKFRGFLSIMLNTDHALIFTGALCFKDMSSSCRISVHTGDLPHIENAGHWSQKTSSLELYLRVGARRPRCSIKGGRALKRVNNAQPKIICSQSATIEIPNISY